MENTGKESYLRELVRALEREMGIFEKDEMSCCGVSLAQCHAIVEIGRSRSISLNQLANILNLDNSTMSRTVNKLVSRGLAERESNPNDRRYVKIKLTKKGSQIFKKIEESMNLYFKEVYQSIPPSKRDQVIESLQLLLEAFNKNKCCE